ncbi:SDR family NAD(P)-dependent oxidoreductase [Vibrio sp. S4M6]|uniref:SDR family NAD(P)-dependent oxidoreductase n=1 Tax=Vibrio sinus TaxID=2946865 RepID=UPI002029F72E|nr:SDR family NAD(P)-dependent oxidoreductase [Vibrio sinus]MCL9781787.1 SDR family NAD(P)-dependent oxidoreductase [Vibrio sinus]
MKTFPSDILLKANPLEELEQWASKYLLLQVRRLGIFTSSSNSSGQVEELRLKAGVHDRYARWWEECCLSVLQQWNFVQHQNGYVRLSDNLIFDGIESEQAYLEAWETRKSAYLDNPQTKAVVHLIDECLRHLPDILRGSRAATDVMFPNGSMEKVENLYKHNERADYFNSQVAETARAYIELLIEQRPHTKVRIIEIGAGTGGTTSFVLSHLADLKENIQEYCYTDISNAFLIHGKTEYGQQYPFLTTRLWNIEHPTESQDIESGCYDIVIATNVLHATKNIRDTLRNAKVAMKKNGILLINELIEKTLLGTLTFGLLDGWWRFEDDALRIPGSPLIDTDTWRSVLNQEGFGEAYIPEPKAERLGQQVLVAESDGIIRQQSEVQLSAKKVDITLEVGVESQPKREPESTASASQVDVSISDVEAYVKSALAEALKVEVDTIQKDVPFADYGVDSILGVNFINRLKESLAISLNTAIIFDHSTVERLSTHILQNHSAEVNALLVTSTLVPVDASPVQPVNELVKPEQQAPLTQAPEPTPALIDKGEHQTPITEKSPKTLSRDTDIAVIGISGQFPEAEDVHQFWQNLIDGHDGVTELPHEYLDRERDYSETKQPGKSYCKWGGVLKDRACFDPLFFSLSPKDAESMNQNQRLILQESWKSLEDAGYNPKTLSDRKVGIFVGAEPVRYGATNFTGASEALTASRLSYYLNLKGPAFVVNTGCSSSGVALHLACESLRNRESDMALAGGVHAGLDREALVSTSAIEMLSPRGRCHTLDASGDGTVLSEGVGMVVLKRLEDAITNRDNIYGVIKASGINQDGASNGIIAPNGASQEELITNIYQNYNIDPADISYAELHGTGTRLGDPVEANALVRAFSQFTDTQNFCGLGSAKDHIGHTSAAAGVIGLIKVLLSMKHNQLPGLIHFDTLNPLIELEGSAFNVVDKTRSWVAEPGKPRMAAINSFGHSGTNVHLVVEDYPQPSFVHETFNPHQEVLFVLSAANDERLKEYGQRMLEFVRRGEVHNDNLQRFAHTLQIGREALRYRIAFAVGSAEELIEKLTRFVESNSSDYPVADSKHPSEHMALFLAEDDAQDMMQKWLLKQQWKKLAQLWLSGGHVDWSLLYQDYAPLRMSVPTYPFAKERYWRQAEDVRSHVVPQPKPQVETHSNAQLTHLHPLLHSAVSAEGAYSYNSNFTGQEFFLSDHRVEGHITLPGVAHLEWVRAAFEHACQDKNGAIKLENVVWIQPVIVDAAMQLNVTLKPVQNEEHVFHFEISSLSHDTKTLHCQGRVLITTERQPDMLNVVEKLATLTPLDLDMEAFYESFRQVGIVHGSSYRGVTALSRGQNEILAALALPNVVSSSQHEYVLHPSMMESALQAACLLIVDHKAHSGVASLPFALESICIYGPCTQHMYARVRYAKNNRNGGNVVKLDVDLIDADGHISVVLEGFSFRRLHSDAPDSVSQGLSSQGQGENLLLTTLWREASFSSQVQTFDHKDVFLFDRSPAAASDLMAQLPGTLCLAQSLPERDIALRYEHYTLACLDHVQSMINQRPDRKVLLQVVVPDTSEGQILEGIAAFLKTVSLEHPQISGQIIVTSPHTGAIALAQQLVEASKSLPAKIVKFHHGSKRVLEWQQVLTQQDAPQSPFKHHGTYVITGGSGGLGLIFAREILQRTSDARVIVIGRSTKDAWDSEQNSLPQAWRHRVTYVQADVADREQLSSVFSQLPSLDGIIHSAGMNSDQAIGKKTPCGLQQVLAAKVAGTYNLDLLTKTYKLDFIVLFSSVSAVFGNPGQADYAAGNAFMDSFSRWRNALVEEGNRCGRTLSINWPLWKEGGMRLSDTQQDLMRQTLGGMPMPTLDGLSAFYQSFYSGHDQVVVLHGNKDKMKTFVGINQPLANVSEKVPENLAKPSNLAIERQRNPQSSMPIEISLHDIRKLLLEEVSTTIGLEQDKIELDAELSQYGFDSIVLMDFIRDLNQKYQLDLMPTVFFEYPTIVALAEYLDQNHLDTLSRYFSAQSSDPNIESPTVHPKSELIKDEVQVEVPQQNLAAQGGKKSKPGQYQDIAIIGMDGTFPQSDSVEGFWEMIRTGKDLMEEIPKDHWDYRPWFSEDRDVEDKTYCKWGSFIDDVDRFDAEFFNISPKEAEWMDPQMRLLLQSVYRCGEDAGRIKDIRGSKTGIFVGVCSHDYMDVIAEQSGPINPHQGVGTALTVIANRVSFLLNLTGPSLSFNTACSASLVALHEACHALQRNECEMAFVGGVNVLLSSHHYRYFSSIGALSPTGRSHSFDSRADGYAPGEAIASLLLKPLDKAIKDGDQVYAVIKGSAALHGGFTPSITAPSVSGEKNVITSAWKNADIDPATIGYIEAHGTGTKLGDPIEVSALTQAFQEFTSNTGFCALGSAKAHVGHTEGSAGILGVIKAVQQLRHQVIPAMPAFREKNPYIELDNSALYINRETIPWPAVASHPRRAGVSSFGFSGVYAHVVLEEHTVTEAEIRQEFDTQSGVQLIALSAKTENSLNARIQDLLHFVQTDTKASLAEIAYTLQVGRESMKYRLGFVTYSKTELIRTLQSCLIGQPVEVYRGEAQGKLDDYRYDANDASMQQWLEKWREPEVGAQLIERWTLGQPVEWGQLHRSITPHRVRLPTYPFSGERYWFMSRTEDNLNVVKEESISSPIAAKSKPTEVTQVDKNLYKNTLDVLREMISEETKIPLHRIEPEKDFEELGLDSIIIATLNKRIAAITGNTDSTLFFKHKHLSSLAKSLSHDFSKPKEAPAQSELKMDQIKTEPEVVQEHTVSESSSLPKDDDIAIIGMSGRYPQASNLDTFWQNLLEGRDAIQEIPKERFDYSEFYDAEKGAPGKIYCKWGGFIDNADKFDAAFFKLSPQDARYMDPQERIFLEAAWECMESAGQIGPNWQRDARNVGVFAGATFNNYQLIMAEAADSQAYLANSQTFSIANRVSYFLNFTGPSFTLDTACSSSLLAIHQACESLKRGECEMALAGGVNLSLHPSKYITLCATGFAASDGRCHAFAANGDGYVPSEGVGAVLLKPYARAVSDGDEVLAVIKGTGISHDGKTQGYTVPNPIAQSKAIEAALGQAGISADQISYVEAHGTGTELGDPVEIQGLMDVYSRDTDKLQYCAIGSVKSNIGHGEAAAGIAQLSKTVLQLQHKTLVPSLLHDRPNPNIDFNNTAFVVQSSSSHWAQPKSAQGEPCPRYAGISSFGAGGVNVHVIVGEAPECHAIESHPSAEGGLLIPLSAQTRESLLKMADNLSNWLDDQTNSRWSLESIAHTLQTRRAPFVYRLAVIAESKAQACAILKAFAKQEESLSADWFESSANKKQGFRLDLSGEEDRGYVNTLINKGRFDKLAQLWVNGADIPWAQFYTQNIGCAPLPTYPFDRKRYWAGSPSSKSAEVHKLPDVQRISAETVLREGMFDVQWQEMAQSSSILPNRLRRLLVVSESTTVLEQAKWADTELCRCLITGDVSPSDSGDGDIIISKDRLNFDLLREQICEGAWDGLVYVPSAIDFENCDSTTLVEHVAWETHKLHRWVEFLTNELVDAPIQATFLSVVNKQGVDPVQTLLAKYFSFLRYEFPEFQVSIIQVDSLDKNMQQRVINEMAAQSNETHVQFEGNKRLVQRLMPIEIDQTLANFDASGCMVITGGFGGLGLKLIHWLMDKGVTELAVIGRKPSTSRLHHPALESPITIEKLIQKYQQRGIKLHYIQADLHQVELCMASFASARAHFNNPITGIFHLAGVTTEAIPLNQMREETLIDVLGSKFFGGYALDRITAKDPVRYFCMFSSTSAIEGMQVNGLSAYATSNAALDALAEARRLRKQPIQLIHWSDWDEVGMAVEHDHKAFMDAVGIHMLPTETGLSVLEAILSRSISSSTVFHVNWDTFSQVNELIHKLPFFNDYVQFMRHQTGSEDMVNTNGNEQIASKVNSKPQIAQNRERMVAHLSEKLADIIELDVIPVDESLASLGLDSINSIQYFKGLSTELTMDISPSIIFRYPTIAKLSEYLWSQLSSDAYHGDRREDDDLSLVEELNAALKKSEHLLNITA